LFPLVGPIFRVYEDTYITKGDDVGDQNEQLNLGEMIVRAGKESSIQGFSFKDELHFNRGVLNTKVQVWFKSKDHKERSKGWVTYIKVKQSAPLGECSSCVMIIIVRHDHHRAS
jgi:hypothetical protein